MTGALASRFFSPGWECGEKKREQRQRKGFGGRETNVGEGREEDETAIEWRKALFSLGSGHENLCHLGSSQGSLNLPIIWCHWCHSLIQPGPVPVWLEPIGRWTHHSDQTHRLSNLHINSKGRCLLLHLGWRREWAVSRLLGTSLLFFCPHLYLSLCQSGKEPSNLALAEYIFCFGPPSIPPLEKFPPSCLPHAVCEDTNRCAACCKDGVMTQAEPTTGLLPWQHALSEGRWANDANRTKQNHSLRKIYTPWENECSLLAGVPKLVKCNFGTCTSIFSAIGRNQNCRTSWESDKKERGKERERWQHWVLYLFSGTALKTDCNLGGLQHQKFLLSQFWRPEDWNQGVHRALLCLEAPGESLFLASSRSGGCQYSLVFLGCTTPISASVFMLPSLCVSPPPLSVSNIPLALSYRDACDWNYDSPG